MVLGEDIISFASRLTEREKKRQDCGPGITPKRLTLTAKNLLCPEHIGGSPLVKGKEKIHVSSGRRGSRFPSSIRRLLVEEGKGEPFSAEGEKEGGRDADNLLKKVRGDLEEKRVFRGEPGRDFSLRGDVVPRGILYRSGRKEKYSEW